MKKLLTLALSLSLCCGMLAFAACKKDTPAPQSSESAPVSESSSETSSEISSEISSVLPDLSESGVSSPDELSSADMME